MSYLSGIQTIFLKISRLHFQGLMNAVDPRGSSSYKFDYSAGAVLNDAAANALKIGALPQSPGQPTT